MKKVLLLGMLALAGCTGTPSSTVDVASTIAQVQSVTRSVCKFVPTVATIATILGKGSIASVADLANSICLAVTTAPLADGPGRVPKVNGVVIKGEFVK